MKNITLMRDLLEDLYRAEMKLAELCGLEGEIGMTGLGDCLIDVGGSREFIEKEFYQRLKDAHVDADDLFTQIRRYGTLIHRYDRDDLGYNYSSQIWSYGGETYKVTMANGFVVDIEKGEQK